MKFSEIRKMLFSFDVVVIFVARRPYCVINYLRADAVVDIPWAPRDLRTICDRHLASSVGRPPSFDEHSCFIGYADRLRKSGLREVGEREFGVASLLSVQTGWLLQRAMCDRSFRLSKAHRFRVVRPTLALEGTQTDLFDFRGLGEY